MAKVEFEISTMDKSVPIKSLQWNEHVGNQLINQSVKLKMFNVHSKTGRKLV